MKISVSIIVASAVFVAKTSAICWSEVLFGIPCCKNSSTEAIKENEYINLKWGKENNNWCGISNESSGITVPESCPSYTIDENKCKSRGGKVLSALMGACPSPTCFRDTVRSDPAGSCPLYTYPNDLCTSKGGRVIKYTMTGCPIPTCIFPEKKCWAKKLGYPCCEIYNQEVVYSDDDGDWGLTSNNEWCGIIPSPSRTCSNYDKYDEYTKCKNVNGEFVTTTVNGCPSPTCIPHESCKAEGYNEKCCIGEATEVAYISEKWPYYWDSYNNLCVPDNVIPETQKPCPTSTVDYDDCRDKHGTIVTRYIDGCDHTYCANTKKSCPTYSVDRGSCTAQNGSITSVTVSGCPSPTCVINKVNPNPKSCFSEKLGYPCCQNADTEVVYTDEDGFWGIENNDWCGIPDKKPCPAHTFDYANCNLIGGSVSTYTVSGCPTPTCVDDPKRYCWSESMYDVPCCKNTRKVEYQDESGSFGIENGEWCGIPYPV